MARLPRFNIIGQPQHVIIRGNNKNPIFNCNDDYLFYLEKLAQACEKHNCSLHAYVLMTNHVHLLITPNEENSIAKSIQMIGRYYVQYFNKRYNRTGTLWEGRYKATLIDSNVYALICYRYIELNPVRAKMVTRPEDYPWSSYQHNAQGKPNQLITQHPLYSELGLNPASRQQSYKALFNQLISNEVLGDIRSKTNKGWVLGKDDFKESVAKELNRATSPKKRGGHNKGVKSSKSNRV